MLNKINDLIIKTVIAVEPLLWNGIEMFMQNNNQNGPRPKNCFELLGFDVLID